MAGGAAKDRPDAGRRDREGVEVQNACHDGTIDAALASRPTGTARTARRRCSAPGPYSARIQPSFWAGMHYGGGKELYRSSCRMCSGSTSSASSACPCRRSRAAVSAGPRAAVPLPPHPAQWRMADACRDIEETETILQHKDEVRTHIALDEVGPERAR